MRLAVCSAKGGVGKTSTAANLAAVLATRGRVLAVDADPQDSLGRAVGVVAKGREDSLAGLLKDPDADLRAAVRVDVAPGLDLLPAHPSLEAVGVALASQGGLLTGIRRVACSLWDKEGMAAREVAGALAGTDLPLLTTRIPLSRRVPSSTLAKRPVVLSARRSSVTQAFVALAEELLASHAEKVHP